MPDIDEFNSSGAIRVRADALARTDGWVHTPFSVTGALVVQTGAHRFYNDSGVPLVVRAIRASVGTAPTGAAIILDVNKNGTTIYTTQANRPTIPISGFTVKSTNPDVNTFADGDYITVDVDQIGSTVAGSNLVVTVWLGAAPGARATNWT